MKSTGEVMSIGRTFEEALNKALRSLEVKIPKSMNFTEHLFPATDLRIFALFEALRNNYSVEKLASITKITPWFLIRLKRLVELENSIRSLNGNLSLLNRDFVLNLKQNGFSDLIISSLLGISELEFRKIRKKLGVIPTYKVVDSCAGEFKALTPYYYSCYEIENEATSDNSKKIVVLGSGPIRIGQGIEFDYACTHAAFELKSMGYKSIMINNNPETVSTDFDTSDRLYFEPLTFEDVMNIIENETPVGVIVQLGGQTSVNLAEPLSKAGVNVLGTSIDGIDVAEDRERFRSLLNKLNLIQPENGTAKSEEEALSVASKIGYPVVVRPSYVIAGRAMEIVRNEEEMRRYINEAVEVSQNKPVLIDKYLDNAIECEVDAVSDGKNLFIGGIMEHIEPAGVHSGDANIVLPPIRLTSKDISGLIDQSKKISKALEIIGFVNLQFVIKEGKIYVLEANPRASRTVPFVSKAIGIPMTKLAIRSMLGEKLEITETPKMKHFAVKSVVFPFLKLIGTDIALGPEMRSTGETMGIGKTFEMAYFKALLAAGIKLKPTGSVFLSLREEDKVHVEKLSKLLKSLGYTIYGTIGTVGSIEGAIAVSKIGLGKPDPIELIQSKSVDLVINTPRRGGKSTTDGFRIRRASIQNGIPCITNLNTAFELLNQIFQ
jgi:carbamoyl-phosphate synthase large subunit